MTILISNHAEGRVRDRFPTLRHVRAGMIHEMLRTIVETGDPIESYVIGDSYRKGLTPDGNVIILHVKQDRYNQNNRVVTTVFTADQVLPGARKL